MQSQYTYERRIKTSLDKAESYTRRRQGKHAAEMRLLERALQRLAPVATFLDAPCGTGRATILLQQRGYRTTGVDLGDGSLAVARRKIARLGLQAETGKADLAQLPFRDRRFDGVLCFRFFHHLPDPALRGRVIAELCRVADRYVLLSYFSPFSVTSMKRALRSRLGGRRSAQYATPLKEVAGYFAAHGFRLVHDCAQRPLFHTLHLAIFERTR